MRGHVRPVSNHRRQSINKSLSTLHLQSSKKRLGEIQSYLHHIKPSIGVGFKILVGDPLFFPLDGQTKGELLWVQQMATTWEDPVISVSKLIGHFILLDLYDISLIIKNVFLSRHGSHFISFFSKRYAHHI